MRCRLSIPVWFSHRSFFLSSNLYTHLPICPISLRPNLCFTELWLMPCECCVAVLTLLPTSHSLLLLPTRSVNHRHAIVVPVGGALELNVSCYSCPQFFLVMHEPLPSDVCCVAQSLKSPCSIGCLCLLSALLFVRWKLA